MVKLSMWLLPKLLKYLNSKGIYACIWYHHFEPRMAQRAWRFMQ